MSDGEGGAVFARFIVGDVFDGLAGIEDGTVDLVVTSPPFLALRSYLPADHPDKGKEIGSEATPAEFIDTLLRVTAELRRVLAPHGSICVELGDTYAGSGGAGGDYDEDGWRSKQEKYLGSGRMRSGAKDAPQDDDGGYQADQRVRYEGYRAGIRNMNNKIQGGGPGWPLAKSKALIPELYRIALAYGINPLTGEKSPAGRWRIRNVVTWCRPNPPVGALGDKWRPATSDIVVACTSDKRYWDDIATRKEPAREGFTTMDRRMRTERNHDDGYEPERVPIPSSAPLLDWWELAPGGYPGSHYAVYPPALVEPLIKAMAPPKVCRTCGEPSRRISDVTEEYAAVMGDSIRDANFNGRSVSRERNKIQRKGITARQSVTTGWTDCGHNNWRPAVILDPFVGSGTTLAVATGHGHDAIGIDLDERNYDLALERVGPLVLGPPEKPQPKEKGKAQQ